MAKLRAKGRITVKKTKKGSILDLQDVTLSVSKGKKGSKLEQLFR